MRNHALRTISDIDFSKIVSESLSYADICRKLGLRCQGSNYNVIKTRIHKLGIGISHFAPKCWSAGIAHTIPLENILVENSDYTDTNALKKRLIKGGHLEQKCFKCGNAGEWMGERLILQLDHINGSRRDNRLENLRIACPNCHTQTDTHSGKRFKRHYFCKSCNREYPGVGEMCLSCRGKLQPQKFIISKEELSKLIWETPLINIAKKYNVGLTCVRGRCADMGLETPPQGYWLRKRRGRTHEESLVSVKKIRPPAKRMSKEQRDTAKLDYSKGASIRSISQTIGFHHTTVARMLRGITKYTS